MTTADKHQGAQRHPWSLQTKLMTVIIAIVVVMVVSIALSAGAALSRILQLNLDDQIRSAANNVQLVPGGTAADALSRGRQIPGTLLVMRTPAGALSGAYIDETGTVNELLDDEIQSLIRSADPDNLSTVNVPDVGSYRVHLYASAGFSLLLGLPLAEVSNVIGRILTSVALVTACGLLLLAIVIAVVIRVGLRPLRAVAATATRVGRMRMDSGEVSITERVPDHLTDNHTEIGKVGAALNSLLDNVHSSLSARQRNEQLMRDFVADASHELRTPLSSIRGYSELSLRSMRLAPESPATAETLQLSFERIQAQSLRMTNLVEDLLLLARLDEGTELVYSPVDLTRVVIDAVGDAGPAAPDHHWLLDVGEEAVWVAGDSSRLYQVIANILVNARTHTPAGSIVTTSIVREENTALLRVHDDGPGIDPSIAEKLFDRFSRADISRDRKTGGTGLGLSIAKAIVDAHGGSIRVQSEPGDTTFEVRFPTISV